jgi:hypothetical protein
MSKWEIVKKEGIDIQPDITGKYQTLGNALYTINNAYPKNIMNTTKDGEIIVSHQDREILIVKQH